MWICKYVKQSNSSYYSFVLENIFFIKYYLYYHVMSLMILLLKISKYFTFLISNIVQMSMNNAHTQKLWRPQIIVKSIEALRPKCLRTVQKVWRTVQRMLSSSSTFSLSSLLQHYHIPFGTQISVLFPLLEEMELFVFTTQYSAVLCM